jgi:hypothetical protein
MKHNRQVRKPTQMTFCGTLRNFVLPLACSHLLPTATHPKNRLTFSQWQLREGDPLYRVGVKNLSTSHLVAHIIRDKTKAEQLLETIPTLDRIANASIVQLKQAGLTKAQAEALHAAVEIARRWMSSTSDAPQISSPADVMRLFQNGFRGEKQERLVVLTLNTKNRMTHHETVFKGSLSGTTHPTPARSSTWRYGNLPHQLSLFIIIRVVRPHRATKTSAPLRTW